MTQNSFLLQPITIMVASFNTQFPDEIEINQYCQNVSLKNIAIDSREWTSIGGEKMNEVAKPKKLDLEVRHILVDGPSAIFIFHPVLIFIFYFCNGILTSFLIIQLDHDMDRHLHQMWQDRLMSINFEGWK